MIEFRALGPLDLTGADGASLSAVAARPKRAQLWRRLTCWCSRSERTTRLGWSPTSSAHGTSGSTSYDGEWIASEIEETPPSGPTRGAVARATTRQDRISVSTT